MTAIRAGVVGTGYLGALHARILTEIPNVAMAGFVEPNDDVANAVAGVTYIASHNLIRVGALFERN